MLKFIVNKDKVVVDQSIILNEEFLKILEYGRKKKDLDKANSMLLYVYFCCDLSEHNQMKDVDYRQKPDQAKTRAFKVKNYKFSAEEESLIDAAIHCYNFFNETAAERAELAIEKKIDEARTKLEESKIEVIRNTNPSSGKIEFTSNESIIRNIAESIDSLMSLKLKIRQTSMKINNTSRVKANKGSSIIERGGFKDLAKTSD